VELILPPCLSSVSAGLRRSRAFLDTRNKTAFAGGPGAFQTSTRTSHERTALKYNL
jgi:hypothetical protein